LVKNDFAVRKVFVIFSTANVLNAHGAKVMETSLKNRSTMSDVSRLSIGLYFLHFVVGNERKIIKIAIQ